MPGRTIYLFMAAAFLLGALASGLVAIRNRPAGHATGPPEVEIRRQDLPAPGSTRSWPASGLAVTLGVDRMATALDLSCPYLGCVVVWDGQAELFRCPCHGAVYAPDGSAGSGPAPAHLSRYPLQWEAETLHIRRDVHYTMIGRELAPDVQYPDSTLLLHMRK